MFLGDFSAPLRNGKLRFGFRTLSQFYTHFNHPMRTCVQAPQFKGPPPIGNCAMTYAPMISNRGRRFIRERPHQVSAQDIAATSAFVLFFAFRPRYPRVREMAKLDFAADRIHQKSALDQRRLIRAVEQPAPFSLEEVLRGPEPAQIFVRLAVHRVSQPVFPLLSFMAILKLAPNSPKASAVFGGQVWE